MLKTKGFPSFSLRPLNLLAAVLLVLAFALAGLAGKPAYAATPGISLSVNSGPTGMYLTIHGFNQQQNLINGYDYGLLTFQNSDPSKNLPSFMTFGAASIKSDGTFTWTGPLPRAGFYDTPDGPLPYQVPLGHMEIVFFEFNGFSGGRANFTITDNTNGPFADDTNTPIYSMDRLWKRTDQLIAAGETSRSWLWGPRDSGNGFVTMLEPYAEASHGWRFVTYYDKARMEVTKPAGDFNSPYYVTNGLLVQEMVTGKMQLGDNTFQTTAPAQVPAAGDFSPDNQSPTFAAYAQVMRWAPYQDGDEIRQELNPDGTTYSNNALPDYNVRAVHFVNETAHHIASPFWDYLNSTGLLKDDDNNEYTGRIFDPLFYATGYPITEAYWTITTVGGETKDVLVQMFERRVLTYTPSNPPAYRVEMGNVGLQYYQWRYNRG
jgi:hypothetical protein